MAGNMKLLDQVYQQEHHQAKTLSLKALQHPQVILRHAGYPAFPCLRIPHTIARESSQDQSNSPEQGLGAHGACSSWESHRQQGHSSLSRTHRQQGQALASPGSGTERRGTGTALALPQQDKEGQFVSQGKRPAIRSNASKGARREEAIR